LSNSCKDSNSCKRSAKILFALCLCLALNPAQAKTEEKGLKFIQTHAFFGHCLLAVDKEGIRLENQGPLHFKMVSRAPKWDVVIFRDDDKTFFSESLEKFEENGLVSGIILAKKDRYVEKNRTSTFIFCGKKIQRITAALQTLKYIPLDGLPPQVERIIFAAYKVPTNGGIPIAFIRTLNTRDYITGMRDQGKIETSLDTKSIEEIAVDDKIFQAPAGYKLAKSVREVVAGASTRTKNADFKALFDPVR